MDINRKVRYGLIAILIAVSSLIWLGYVDVPITNEDYLILSWMEPGSFSESFNNFFMREVGGPYWRPVTWTADSLTKFLYGYEPVPFHVTNILIYLAICILFFVFLRRIGFNFLKAWLGAFSFSVLPSHELSVAWIAGRTDTMMAMFLLAATVLYMRMDKSKITLIIAFLLFMLSALSKEPAFAAAALPMMLYFLSKEKYDLKKTIITTFAMVMGVMIILIFRAAVIGGTPFESSNFSNFNLTDAFKNFIIYFFAGFLRADTIELIYHYFSSTWTGIILTITLGLIFIITIIYRFKKSEATERKLALFGLMWFIIFIIPATAQFGQWYAFTSSMGLIITLLALLGLESGKLSGRLIIAIIIISGLLSAVNLMDRSRLWHNAANIISKSFNSLAYPVKETDTLILLGVPDKVNMINCAKIGCEQAVWKRYNSKKIEVSSPLRAEINDDTEIKIKRENDSVVILNIFNGRLLPVGQTSRAVIIPETYYYEDGFQKFNISTYITKSGSFSQALITIKERTLRNRIFAFDGRKFVHLE